MTTDSVAAFDGQLWLASYGLQQDPFAARQFEFLSAGQRGENLSSLKHLALFSGKILLVTGREGSGKSTLLREWLKRQDSSLFLTVMQASAELQRGEWVRRMGAEIGLTDALSRSAEAEVVIPLIREACIKRFDNGVKTVIAIDDAEHLSSDDLKFLAAQLAPAGSEAISLVLLGLPALQQRVLDALPDEVEQNRVCQIQLKPLSRSEVKLYVESRLRQGGWSGTPALSDAVIGLIADSARGNPASINEVAPKLLVQNARADHARRSAFPLLPRQQLMMGAGLIGVVLVVIALLYSSPDDTGAQKLPAAIPTVTEGERVTLTLDQFPDETPAKSAVPDTTAGADDELSGDEALFLPPGNAEGMDPDFSQRTIPPEVQTPEAPTVALALPLKGLEPVKQAKPATLAAPVEKVQPVEKNQAEKATAEKKPREAVPADAASGTALLRDQRWMNEQSKKAWTVQMLGTLSKESATDYLREWKLKGHTPFYFESVYKGKPWYIVLLGTYRSKDDARKAMEQLPADIRKQGPWLRSVASLQTSS